MIASRVVVPILIPALLLGACRGDDDDTETGAAPPDTGVPAARDTAGMSGMSGMAGMGAGMANQMMSHMQSMQGAGADSMRAMLPMHRQMVANMIAQMNREMRDMNMTMDAQWNATVDSLRDDLRRMPEMSAQELRAFMPAHRDRVMRLMEMHGTMMKNMRT
jgi:hypothetical protein